MTKRTKRQLEPIEMCGEELRIGNGYGEPGSSFKCQKPKGHDGRHQEMFDHPAQSGGSDQRKVFVSWHRLLRSVK